MSIPERTKLGRYEIRSPLGAGGMGEVYLAYDLSLHRSVAIKVLRADLTSNKDRLRRFEREAHAASSLNHPNILTIYEVGRQGEYQFIATEFVEGESLGKHLRAGAFTLDSVLEIGMQIASALSAAHDAGIVHRDIKPDNIMLRSDQLVKVLDFGLAKLSEQQGSDSADTKVQAEPLQLTMPGVVMGTARYMSPEQARGLKLDERTDIWSLGVVLYQMITGHLPFPGKTMSDVMASVLRAEPPPMAQYSPDLPEEIQRIVSKALRKDTEERYQHVKDLEFDLKSLKQQREFEIEFARSGETRKSATGKGQTTPAVKSSTTPETAAPTESELTHVHSSSSASYLLNEMKRHKRGASLILASILALTIVAYLGYTRYSKGSSKAGISSVAVLPFVNASNDPEKEYLSQGISESLINRLSQVSGVKVIANTSSSRYKGLDIDPQVVAAALDVGAVLTGKIMERGDNLIISVELIDGRDRTHLWGEQYNRKLTDLLQVQAEISSEIVEKLKLRLTSGQQQQMAHREQVNTEAYEALLKGHFYRSKGSAEDRRKAAEYFNQAISIDPAYALAYADLSDIYRSFASSSLVDPREYLSQAKAAAEKALELDDNLADGHYAVANLETYSWEWADAEREYNRAIELSPNLALAHRWYASYLRLVGQHEKAIAEIKRARELDPLSPGVNATVGYILLSARQYDQAIEALKQTLDLDPGYPYTHLFLGLTYSAKGMHDEAIAAYQEAIKSGLDSPSTKINLGAEYARAGDRKHAEEILSRLRNGTDYVSPGELAIIYAGLGERDQAFASLDKAYETHDLQLQYLGVSPWFDPLRSDPRFHELLRRVGLPTP